MASRPEGEEDGEQQQWVFGGLTERFRLFNQQLCPIRCRRGFWRGIAFDAWPPVDGNPHFGSLAAAIASNRAGDTPKYENRTAPCLL